MMTDTPKILSKKLLTLGVSSFLEAIKFVKTIPYGRNSDRSNPDLIIKEFRGTCSTKHAFIKKMAIEQSIGGVKLVLCMYKMNGVNTPKIEDILGMEELDFIPEAHCLLEINGHMVDITTKDSDYATIANDVIEMVEIQPEQIGEFKENYHKDFIKNWILTNGIISHSFEEIWNVRELCIKALSS